MNEFKRGDLVVNKSDKYLGDINQVISYWDNKMRLKGHSHFHVYVADGFRLATPEEIKAGKRLCTHSMTEITVFGDLKRTYKCEKCGHEEYEEWVSHD